MTLDENSYILAIEAAISGGSLSLFKGRVEIAGWSGPAGVSKAEDLLFNIDVILRESGITKRDLALLAVSAGPGSFTGIRIGLATALGLKAGLEIPMASESALKAMVYSSGYAGTIAAAVPSGRNAVCVQRFNSSNDYLAPIDEPHTLREDDFFSVFEAPRILAHTALFESSNDERFVDCGTNIARYIALACRENPDVVTQPLFITKSF